MKRTRFSTVFLVFTILASTALTGASIIYFKTFKERRKAADAIFVGTAISIGAPTPPASHYGWEDAYSATFQISKSWRGAAARQITINVSSPADYSFFPGRTYLVYSKQRLTSEAWYPRLADDPEAKKEIELLGPPAFEVKGE